MSQQQQQQKKNKMVFVMVDGLGDTSIPKYNRQTTLEKANTNVMDLMAKSGVSGAMDPVEPGYACGSDTAHLSILGYDPRTYYRGRGAFESMGAGLDMNPGDIAFKSNFATLDTKTGIVIQRRADRNFEHLGPTLCDHLTGIKLPSFPEYRVDVKYATEHRCGVRVRGPLLSDAISSTDPLKDNLPLLEAKPLNETTEAKITAKVTNELSNEIQKALENHPINIDRREKGLAAANVVLLRGCGVRVQAPTFNELYDMNAFMIAPTCIIAGLGMSVGVDVVEAPGGTGDYHTNLQSKADTLVNTIVDEQDSTKKSYQFGFLHIKAVDDAGHDKNEDLKVSFLERIDKMLESIIVRLAQAERDGNGHYSICVTGDHSTPVLSGDHSSEPVPFVITKPILVDQLLKSKDESNSKYQFSLTDSVDTFSEIECIKGALGRFPGSQVMKIIPQYMNQNVTKQ
ncbi:phosphonopyruvate decarboxylase-like protein [Cavenderia fasciculata]|uniref:Phosphonopyruvate decarboxylase-like protein n=1 Tax=Cavenderia fasciculata TaxID=261658 RepID=F4Q0J6_CACFS|nr:phosphonopyruvate decarboxylase-like protein [Cavenderia fasciculata]EGG18347.1 phosphonopyruvate decarboxylase-like protein [Cavenderia fasciculata]|eukprot:XP_004366251.1 phosphonopyruvate decarboxylase-like protein [Cavenderia fasciculata]